jgi:hypothetical protein
MANRRAPGTPSGASSANESASTRKPLPVVSLKREPLPGNRSTSQPMGTETRTYTNDEPRKKVEMTVAEKRKRGNQRPSELIRGHQSSSEALRGHQRQSELIRGTQRSSEAIRAHRRHSEVIRGHQSSSEATQPPEKRKGGPESRYGRVGSSVATAVPESATAIRLSMTEGEST